MEEALEEEVSHQVLQEDPSVVEVHLEEEALQEASKYNSVQFFLRPQIVPNCTPNFKSRDYEVLFFIALLFAFYH